MTAPIVDPQISRATIIAKLESWQRADINEVMMLEWADLHVNHPEACYLDREAGGSAAHEVLLLLSCLDMHLVIADDVPCYLEFLRTPPGQFENGLARLHAALEKIDIPARRRTLANNPLYQLDAKPGADFNGNSELF